MPTYDYVCDACGHALEIFHSITEAAKRKCPGCGKNKLQRRIGPGAGILFKGTGFYTTDYRSASYKAGAQGEKDGKDAKAPAAEAKPAETPSSSDSRPSDSKSTDPKPSDPKPADPGGGKRKAS